MLKKLFMLFLVVVFCALALNFDSVEAKKSSKGKLSDEEMTNMSTTVDYLTKKMYANGLFSPDDNENLIDIKIKLDNQMLSSPDVSLAPLYYKVGLLYKTREMKKEAVDCFQTILENFSDTALAPKAEAELKSMGVEVKTKKTQEGEGEKSE